MTAHPVSPILACLAALLAFPAAGAAQHPPAKTVTLPPGLSEGQLILASHPPRTHFHASGLILHGGKSHHFQSPPKFALLSHPKHDPAANFGYPDTETLESWELPNAEIYPCQLRDLDSPSLSGLTVIGLQSRDLPWRVVKSMWDGDALHIKGCTGSANISDVYFENVEDGLGPEAGLDSWTLKNAYMRFIRDDAIENDDLIPGHIENCLIDGCFVFLSQRPGEPLDRTPLTTVVDCLVHLQAQPHDGTPHRTWRDRSIKIGEDGIGRAPGPLFKWDRDVGTVLVRDSIFKIDALSVNGADDMDFPPGRYENVTLIWLGEGDYPRPLPEGVTLTRDTEPWHAARARWIKDLPPTHPAAPLLKPSIPTETAPR